MKLEELKRELPSWLKDAPVVEAFWTKKKQEILKERTAAAQRIEKLQADLSAALPGLEAKIAETDQELAAVEKQRQDLLRKRGEATDKIRALKFSTDREILTLQTQLQSTYDPAIDEAIDFFRERQTQLMRGDVIRSDQFYRGERNPGNDKKLVKTISNLESVQNAVSYCRAAIRELEEMKLKPACDHERLGALRADVPTSDTVIEREAWIGKPAV